MNDERKSQLARAGAVATRAFESIPGNSKNAAALQMLGVSVRSFYELGYDQSDLMRAGEAIWRAWAKEMLDE